MVVKFVDPIQRRIKEDAVRIEDAIVDYFSNLQDDYDLTHGVFRSVAETIGADNWRPLRWNAAVYYLEDCGAFKFDNSKRFVAYVPPEKRN